MLCHHDFSNTGACLPQQCKCGAISRGGSAGGSRCAYHACALHLKCYCPRAGWLLPLLACRCSPTLPLLACLCPLHRSATSSPTGIPLACSHPRAARPRCGCDAHIPQHMPCGGMWCGMMHTRACSCTTCRGCGVFA